MPALLPEQIYDKVKVALVAELGPDPVETAILANDADEFFGLLLDFGKYCYDAGCEDTLDCVKGGGK